MGKATKKDGSQAKPTITDPRFSGVSTDARFRLPSKKQSRVQLDSRFSGLLKDADFSQNAKVDRYGRKVEASEGTKELKKKYQLEDEEETGSESEDPENGSDDDSDSAEASDEEDLAADSTTEDIHAKLGPTGRKYDPARDGGFSSSEEESESEGSEEDETDDIDAAFREDIEEGEVTCRIAVVNLDWDFIRAVDIMAVASSFAPQGGRVLKVSIYPSEFGRERMEREETEGPPRELFQKDKRKKKKKSTKVESDSENSDSDSDSESDSGTDAESNHEQNNGQDFDPSTLRRYQLERLRYYYAVITSSSSETARIIYDTMDGREYLASANFFDLRFVPDDVTFDDEARDECTEVSVGYKPREFVTQALRHSKVQLSWDADDSSRKEMMRKAFDQDGEIDNDLQAYLGSDGSGSEDEQETSTARAHKELLGMSDSDYSGDEDDELQGVEGSKAGKAAALRAALGLGGDSAPAREKGQKGNKSKKLAGNMEVTFVPALAFEDDVEEDNAGVFVNKPDTESTLDKYVRKERERKMRRKQKPKTEEGDDDAAPEGVFIPAKAAEEPLGFDDPFFANPEKHSRDEAKKAKKLQREEKEREAEQLKAKKDHEARELELLMAGDSTGGAANMEHFDMKEVIKQQKAANRKGKKGNKAAAAAKSAAAAAADDFQVNVEDSRFKALFDSHEFAIDPTNPRFVATKGMKSLLDERRKKRKVDDEDVVPDRREKKKREEKPKKDELLKLADKIKQKSGGQR